MFLQFEEERYIANYKRDSIKLVATVKSDNPSSMPLQACARYDRLPASHPRAALQLAHFLRLIIRELFTA